MFHLQDFLDQLDELYEREPRRLEAFLQSGLEKARLWGITVSRAVLRNAKNVYGRYRSFPVTWGFRER